MEGFVDDRAIRTLVARFAHCVDQRRWAELRAVFAEVVRTDYTSLVGGSPSEASADALIASWRRRLEPLDATQHLLGPAEVELDGDLGTARCHVRAYHFAQRAQSGSQWMVAGHYRFELWRAPGGFRVRALTLDTMYQTGNRALLAEAAG